MDYSVLDQWNEAAEKYMMDQEDSEFVKVNKRVVSERFSRFTGKQVLDLGCGYGVYTELFRKLGNTVIGCDGAKKMLALARGNYPACTFQYADLENSLPFADNSFDLVFCNQVLMDIENFENVVKECARITVRGGILYIGIVHPVFYDSQWIQDENGFRKKRVMERYLSEYSITNTFWGETMHYHRTISEYINKIISCGYHLTYMAEPESYDGITKSKEFPLFLFLEFTRT